MPRGLGRRPRACRAGSFRVEDPSNTPLDLLRLQSCPAQRVVACAKGPQVARVQIFAPEPKLAVQARADAEAL